MVDEQIRPTRRTSPSALDLRTGIVLTGATEQMFFFGSPLAHVVAYEEWQREQRRWHTYRRQTRVRRPAGREFPPALDAHV